MTAWPDLIVSLSDRVVRWRRNRVDKVLCQDDGVYYGLSWSADHMFIGARGGISAPLPNDAVLVFDRDRYVGHFAAPNAQTHQIHALENNTFYVAVSAVGQIIRRGPDDDVEKIIQTATNDHPNSVWFDHRGFLWYVLHRRSRRLFRPSRIVTLGRLGVGPLINDGALDVGIEAHNVFATDRYVYFCSSLPGEVMRVDRTNAQTPDPNRDTIALPGYTRGLACDGTYLYVGVSATVGPHARHDGDAYVFRVNMETFQEHGWITISGGGQIGEVRLADGTIDLAHNGLKAPIA